MAPPCFRFGGRELLRLPPGAGARGFEDWGLSAGASVVSTEPVAYYALRNAGITDKTPETFADAVEEGDDPSPADVAAMLDLVNAREVSAVVVNTQTETSATKQISDAARQASLPLIEVTETLPEGLDYLGWQRATVDEIAAQLDSAPQTSR